jgi:electron transfer flavoprotein alpha/beta subunit
MGIRKASKAEIPIWTLADVGCSAPAATVSRTELMNPPSRDIPCEIVSGSSPEETADLLAEKILAEKIL